MMRLNAAWFIAILLIVFSSPASCTEQWMFQSEDKWDKQWRAGQWEYMDKVAIERAKVSVVGVLAQVYAANSTATPSGMGSVLDVGCGEGSLSDFLSADQQAGYVGIDLSKEAILSAKRKRPTMKFVHSAAHKFRPKSKHKTFRVISFADMLYYVDHKSVLSQYNDYLAPGGIVIISMFFQTKGKLLYENIWADARIMFDKIDEMELSGSTKKQAYGKAVVEAATAFHIEVYKKRDTIAA